MDTAVINVKIQPSLKKQAQNIAKKLGINLSSLIKAYLKQLVRTKAISFSVTEEEPTDYLLRAIKESKEDIRAGRVSPGFTDAKKAISWLNNPKRKYANQIRQKIH